ncbi:MAG TPA: peptidylprolyl isomerase [Candidatus Saccharimonadales bacterium]|nr:peptidylprolyl isomerase [Candidatus Saccharimonadales bacterium]
MKIIIPIIVLFVIAVVGFVMFLQPKQQMPKVITLHPSPTDMPTATPDPSATLSAAVIPTTTATPSSKVTPTIGVVQNATQATIHTAKGNIVIQLYPQDAPKTVANFATLAERGYYNNLTFHRVEPGFVIQGGDPNGNGTGGVSIYGPVFNDELNPTATSYKAGYLEGVVAMANRGPNTNGSQFFIMLADNTDLPKQYTIFGKVINGMSVVKSIKVGDKMTAVDISTQ